MTGYIYSDQGVMFGAREVIGFQARMCSVRLIPGENAEAVIVANHYAHRTCLNSFLHLGIFAGGLMVGVLQWGHAMNPASGGSIVRGAKTGQWMELNRMWVSDDAPRNTESSAIAASVKVIRSLYPEVAFLQTFADERCGGLGVVYQAASFGYFGEHTSVFWVLDGEWYHNSMATRKTGGGARADKIRANKERAMQVELRQFRYLRFLRPWARRRCLLKRQPYPKRTSGGEG